MKTNNISKTLIIKCLILALFLFSMNGQGQSLNDYLVIASVNNPEIKAIYTEFEVAMQKSPQVNSLPDPILTMSAFGKMIETRVGAQEARFSLMQMFPWFGTLSAKEDVANLMAEAAFQKYIATKNEVSLNVKKMYAEIYEINKMIEIETQNLQILDTYKKLALSKFSNGKGAMVDIVRIDIKRNESITNIELLENQKRPLQIGFNSMLSRDLNAEIIIPSDLYFDEISLPIERDSLFISNPKIMLLEKKKEAYEAQKLIAKKEGYPMIGLGLDYSIISKRAIPDLEMNGQDAIMPMLTVTLPIFRKKYNASKKEAALMVTAIDYEKQAVQNNLQASYSMADFNLQKAMRLKNLYQKQIESTQQAIKLLLAAYSNSETNFEEILTMNQDLLTLETATISANKNQFIAQAQINYLLSKNESNEN